MMVFGMFYKHLLPKWMQNCLLLFIYFSAIFWDHKPDRRTGRNYSAMYTEASWDITRCPECGTDNRWSCPLSKNGGSVLYDQKGYRVCSLTLHSIRSEDLTFYIRGYLLTLILLEVKVTGLCQPTYLCSLTRLYIFGWPASHHDIPKDDNRQCQNWKVDYSI